MNTTCEISPSYPQTSTSSKAILALVLLAMAVLFNAFSLYYAINNQASLVKLQAANNQTALQLKQINSDLQQAVYQLQENKAIASSRLTKLSTDLNAIQMQLVSLSTKTDIQQLQATISKLNNELVEKTKSHQHKTLYSRHAKKRHRRLYHSHYSAIATKLPFTVTGIDIWNGAPAATINVNGMPDLMMKGDTRVGWTLIALSFDARQAVFKNTSQRIININLA